MPVIKGIGNTKEEAAINFIDDFGRVFSKRIKGKFFVRRPLEWESERDFEKGVLIFQCSLRLEFADLEAVPDISHVMIYDPKE